MYDSHNHLQDNRFDGIRDKVIEEMRASGIIKCVINGTCPDDWKKVAALAHQYPDFIIPSFGLHPWKEITHNWEQKIIHWLNLFPNACIGECGIDRRIKKYDIELQKQVFLAQLRLATERNLPLSIHCINGWGCLVELMESNPLPARGFLLHAYGGSKELVPQFTKLGAYFSFAGYFLHEKKHKVREAFEAVPPDRLLLETDAPEMPPPSKAITHKLANEASHPANLPAVHHQVSEFLDTKKLSENFHTFFLQRD